MCANKWALFTAWVCLQACAHAAPASTAATPGINPAPQNARKTVDDIVQAAQRKSTAQSDIVLNKMPDKPPGGALPSPATAAATAAPTPTLPRPPSLSTPLPPGAASQGQSAVLVGLYLNRHKATAEFNVNGQVRYFSVGDRLHGGWVIEKITSQAVHLSKCSLRQECEVKVMYFEVS
jgi:hypothetical protein